MMPTWTEANGQDDIVWHQASVSGNTASFYVPVSAHKGESGAYITHIYVYETVCAKGRKCNSSSIDICVIKPFNW